MSLAVVLLVNCQKSPINGDLDGQWQVVDVDPKEEGPLGDTTLYYCFSLHVCQLSKTGGVYTSGNMVYEGESLGLDFPYAKSQTAIAKLKQYGIYENPVTFEIIHLDNKKLILKNGDVVVTMRKF